LIFHGKSAAGGARREWPIGGIAKSVPFHQAGAAGNDFSRPGFTLKRRTSLN
jgi:hypothetical protein